MYEEKEVAGRVKRMMGGVSQAVNKEVMPNVKGLVDVGCNARKKVNED